jgi:hypothetical protein
MLVAGHSQVVSLADIGAELERMVALNLRPVVDELDLLFVLDQWAIAPVDVERIAKLKEAIAIVVDEERGHATRKCLIEVQAGNPRIRSGTGRKPVWHNMHLIAEEAEAEIREQIRMNDVVEAGCDAVVQRG